MTLADGSTVGVGINRLGYTDSNKDIDGWLCSDCAGYECDSCGKNIYLDEDITVLQGEEEANYKYHEECLTPEFRALAIEQGELK
jgi:hypothetical protein